MMPGTEGLRGDARMRVLDACICCPWLQQQGWTVDPLSASSSRKHGFHRRPGIVESPAYACGT